MFHNPGRCESKPKLAAPWLLVLFVLCLHSSESLRGQNQPAPFNPQGQPNRSRSGPWNNDVLLYRTGAATKVEKLASFPRAGVPTLARLKDGRLIAAHQH